MAAVFGFCQIGPSPSGAVQVSAFGNSDITREVIVIPPPAAAGATLFGTVPIISVSGAAEAMAQSVIVLVVPFGGSVVVACGNLFPDNLIAAPGIMNDCSFGHISMISPGWF